MVLNAISQPIFDAKVEPFQERVPADWLLGGLQSLCSKVLPRLHHGAEALSQRPRAGNGQDYQGPALTTVLWKEG